MLVFGFFGSHGLARKIGANNPSGLIVAPVTNLAASAAAATKFDLSRVTEHCGIPELGVERQLVTRKKSDRVSNHLGMRRATNGTILGEAFSHSQENHRGTDFNQSDTLDAQSAELGSVNCWLVAVSLWSDLEYQCAKLDKAIPLAHRVSQRQ